MYFNVFNIIVQEFSGFLKSEMNCTLREYLDFIVKKYYFSFALLDNLFLLQVHIFIMIEKRTVIFFSLEKNMDSYESMKVYNKRN